MLTLDPKIVKAFANAGLPLEYVPADKYVEREYWMYDGGFDGVTVELTVGINGAGREGVFGEYQTPAPHWGQYGLSCSMSDWLECFGKYLPKMAKGEEFNW